MRSKAECNVRVAVDDLNAVAVMTDQNVYKHFLSMCSRSATTIIPQTVKWSRYRVARSADRISVLLFKGEKETFRFSFVPPPAPR